MGRVEGENMSRMEDRSLKNFFFLRSVGKRQVDTSEPRLRFNLFLIIYYLVTE